MPGERENLGCAFVRALQGVVIGRHSAGAKSPLRRARHHALLELADLDAALATRSHRGPAAPRFRARVALMIDPTGNTPGLRRARP